jgi:hypothetical protein
MGIGNCRSLPILCAAPHEEIRNPVLDRDYIASLKRFDFPGLEISLPKDFKAVKQQFSKVYYKKRLRRLSGSVAYLLYEPRDFFVKLFPYLAARGITDDYQFLDRTMSARLDTIRDMTDTFFVIMKGIFTPDLGAQSGVRIVRFYLPDRKGFISQSSDSGMAYYDSNMIDNSGNFFKVCIKDKDGDLTLDNFLAILSTAQRFETEKE